MNALSDDEWRFDACPEGQRHWCDIYEHARENKSVVEMVNQYRSTGTWPADSSCLAGSSHSLAKGFVDAFPEFPTQPFLCLPANVRQERCIALNSQRELMQIRVCDKYGPLAKNDGTLILEVHPNAPRGKVMRVIGDLLKECRGPQLTIERLNYLGKLRLYKHFSRWSAVIDYLAHVRSNLATRDETKLSKDKKKAVANVETVFRRIV